MKCARLVSPTGNLPKPYYRERLRDFDNLEHRCVTNLLAAYMLWGDNPKCIISMDVLALGNTNFTEVKIMTISAFRDFPMSEKMMLKP